MPGKNIMIISELKIICSFCFLALFCFLAIKLTLLRDIMGTKYKGLGHIEQGTD